MKRFAILLCIMFNLCASVLVGMVFDVGSKKIQVINKTNKHIETFVNDFEHRPMIAKCKEEEDLFLPHKNNHKYLLKLYCCPGCTKEVEFKFGNNLANAKESFCIERDENGHLVCFRS